MQIDILRAFLSSIFRHFLSLAAGWFISKGLAEPAAANALVQYSDYLAGALLIVIPIVWSHLRTLNYAELFKRTEKVVADMAAHLPINQRPTNPDNKNLKS